MLSSLTPVGASSRQHRWSVTTGWYVVASSVAGLAIGTVAGVAGWLLLSAASAPPGATMAALGVLALGGAIDDRRRRGAAAPSWRRQVDEGWLSTYRGWVVGAGFGAQLGAGVVTIVPSALTYVALAAALLQGSPTGGAAVGLTFGLVRALPLVATAAVDSTARLRRLHAWLDRQRRRVDAAAVAGQTVVGVLALALVLGEVRS